MSTDSFSSISIQLENWLEKRSRSYPRRWLKRYFRFDGEFLSYSKNDSSNGKFNVNISDISDVKMKSDVEGKDILILTMQSSCVESVNESELELSMPNPQTLKTWYNALKECIDSRMKLQNTTSAFNLNQSNSSISLKEKTTRSYENLHTNKPQIQPNLYNKGINIWYKLY